MTLPLSAANRLFCRSETNSESSGGPSSGGVSVGSVVGVAVGDGGGAAGVSDTRTELPAGVGVVGVDVGSVRYGRFLHV